MAISDYVEATLFRMLERCYISLHDEDPGKGGAGELFGGGYRRQSAKFSNFGGNFSNDVAVEFPEMPVGDVVAVGLWDAPAGGNFIWGGALEMPRMVANE